MQIAETGADPHRSPGQENTTAAQPKTDTTLTSAAAAQATAAPTASLAIASLPGARDNGSGTPSRRLAERRPRRLPWPCELSSVRLASTGREQMACA